jgi:hypothetical protein
MKNVLQKLAHAPAVPPTKVLRSKSFLPDAVLVMPSVSFLNRIATETLELIAAKYPPNKSVFVYEHVLFLFPKLRPAL